MLGLSVVISSLTLQQYFRPFSSETINVLEHSGLATIAVTFFLGLLIEGPETLSKYCPPRHTVNAALCKQYYAASANLTDTVVSESRICYNAEKAATQASQKYDPEYCAVSAEKGQRWGRYVNFVNSGLSLMIVAINLFWIGTFAIIFFRIVFHTYWPKVKNSCLCKLFLKCSKSLQVAEFEDRPTLVQAIVKGRGENAPKMWCEVPDPITGQIYMVCAQTNEIKLKNSEELRTAAREKEKKLREVYTRKVPEKEIRAMMQHIHEKSDHNIHQSSLVAGSLAGLPDRPSLLRVGSRQNRRSSRSDNTYDDTSVFVETLLAGLSRRASTRSNRRRNSMNEPNAEVWESDESEISSFSDSDSIISSESHVSTPLDGAPAVGIEMVPNSRTTNLSVDPRYIRSIINEDDRELDEKLAMLMLENPMRKS